jgi:malonyl CoA-acyl carrier protein transacylase
VDCVNLMVDAGCAFAELGPGRVLTGLVRGIAPHSQMFNADSPQTLAAIVESAAA